MKPPRLRDGDLVGLIGPSGVADDALLQRCVTNLESFGLRVKPGKHLRAAWGGYAGTIGQRVEDLHAMFADREVRAVWVARGGSGAGALLPHLDYELVRRNAKIFVGYSDLTALHLAFLARAGLVSFHGPVSSSRFSDFSATFLRTVLMEGGAGRELLVAEANEAEAVEPGQPPFAAIRPGVATGALVGGNLSVVASLVGTPYMPATRGGLVFLEDVGEAPYRIDRMLTQLAQAGITRHAAGVALGVFRKCVPPDNEPSLSLAEVVRTQMEALPGPSAYGLSIGHIPRQVTLPLGIRARFDAGARTITLLEPAVAA